MIVLTLFTLSLLLIILALSITVYATARLFICLHKKQYDRATYYGALLALCVVLWAIIFAIPCTGYQSVQFGNLTVSAERCAQII
jgi:hypothetical protein